MSISFSRLSYLKPALMALFMVTVALFLNACGGEEDEPTTELAETLSEEALVAPAAVEDIAPPAGLEMGEVVPVTLSALQFMPAEAQIAVAVPPVPGMRDKLLPLLYALASEEEIDEAMAEGFFGLSDGIGVQAESYEELAAALGVEAQLPIAVFFDFSETVASAVAAKAAHDAAQPDAPEAGDLAPDSALAQGAPPEAGLDSETADSTPYPSGIEGMDYFEDAEEPDWVAVLGLADPAKARAELERIISEEEDLASLPESAETVEGMALTVRGDYAYFMTETNLVLGDLDLVRSTAGRVANPASFRYGTVECPATAADEAVTLIYGSRYLPLLDQALPILMDGVDPSALPMVQSQIDLYKGMFAEGEDEDPIVGTLSYVDDLMEVLVRADTVANPGIMTISGDALPLRLARYVPDNTLALSSFRFNDVLKDLIAQSMLPAIQAGSPVDVSMAAQIIPQLGDELTIAMTDVGEDGTTGLYILLGLAQPQATQGLLQMFVPMENGMEYEGFTINAIPAPSPIPLYLSFVDDFAIIGTSEVGMKAIIDQHIASGVSGAFAKMVPPYDIDIPRYQAFTFNTQVLGTPLTTLMESLGASTDNADRELNQIEQVVREVRAGKELQDGWVTGRFGIYLNDLSQIHFEKESPEAEGNDTPVAEQ